MTYMFVLKLQFWASLLLVYAICIIKTGTGRSTAGSSLIGLFM